MSLLTPREAAVRLGVAYSTLKQWIYAGRVRTSRTAGGHHRIDSSEVARLLASRDQEASEHVPASRPGGVIVAISGRNQLRGFVEEVRLEGVIAQVTLRIGEQRLTAVITRDAVEELGLRRGDEAMAVIKSTEVMLAREANSDEASRSSRVPRGIRSRRPRRVKPTEREG